MALDPEEERGYIAYAVAEWEHATRAQYDRFTRALPHEGWVEASLFLVAVRNLIRAAKMARKMSDAVQPALDRFNATVPNAVRLRNILEHFDEYQETPIELTQDGSRSWIELTDRGETTRLVLVDTVAAASRLADEVLGAVDYA